MIEIASMALDLLAGSVVFQIPHKPNAKLNIRMGFHRWKKSWGRVFFLTANILKWSRHRSCRRDENSQLLRDVRDGGGGEGDREARRGHEDPDQ